MRSGRGPAAAAPSSTTRFFRAADPGARKPRRQSFRSSDRPRERSPSVLRHRGALLGRPSLVAFRLAHIGNPLTRLCSTTRPVESLLTGRGLTDLLNVCDTAEITEHVFEGVRLCAVNNASLRCVATFAAFA